MFNLFKFAWFNGAGKTTTLLILTTEERPTCGIAFVNGYNLANERSKAIKSLGICPQSINFNQNSSIFISTLEKKNFIILIFNFKRIICLNS
jgi:ABC-type Na+ transport system ATPase subunit NatA